MNNLEKILQLAIREKASDLHVNVGFAPVIRRNTVILPLELPATTRLDVDSFVRSMISEEKYSKLQELRDVDFAMMLPDGNRFRVNVHFQRGELAISFRVIPNKIYQLESLELPPIFEKIMEIPRGLILVTGPTGSGKSTTLAAIIDRINQTTAKRIITLEDPIEYLFTNASSQIEQRELGSDVNSFASGLKHAMRQDPDIIMVGEMRDLETTSAAITAAETGHLVLSTLHTINAAQTIERIIDIYPNGQ